DTADPFGGGQSDSDAFDTHSPDDSGGDPFGGSDDDSVGGPFDGVGTESFGETDDPPGGGAGSGGDPFGGDRASDGVDRIGGQSDTGHAGDNASEAGEDPFGGVQSNGSTQSTDGASEDPFGGSQTGDPGGSGASAPASDDPFGGAQSAPSGDDTPFGEGFDEAMSGGMGGGSAEFDEAEFESEIERIDVGVEGLDDMILGGVPVRSLMTVIGGAGTGKTTFGLQFLDQTMRSGGNGVYITLEETEEAIVSTAEEKGWPFEQYIEDGKLTVVAMDPIEMANSLDSIRGDVARLVNEFGADRLVLDSVSLLEMMYDHPAKRRSEVFDFARSLKRAGVTTMLTSEASADNSY
ncbi:MAG: KaiC, partial [halophilic archaeon J07HB67]